MTLDVRKRKVLRNIYGNRRTDVGWKRSSNELKLLHTDAYIINFIKAQRPRLLGHILRMKEGRMAKTVIRGSILEIKKWMEAVKDDLREASVENCQK